MCDVLIIGGGPAGYHAAELAAKEGLQTVLFEKRAVGGVCLNEGCIPSKALLYSAKLFDNMNGYGKHYGVSCADPKLDYEFAVRRKDKVVKKLVSGIEAALKKGNVTIVRAHATIEARLENGFAVTAGGERYEGAKLLICAGSDPVIPPVEGLQAAIDSGFALTNREILALTQPPRQFVVVGGGVIGLEMASLMNSAGADVTVIEMMNKIAGPTDADISTLLQKNYEAKGVKFILGAKVTKFGKDSVFYEKNGVADEIVAEKVLVSIGRRAVTAQMGLENIGLLLERGAIVTDAQQKTNVPGVFAAGDVNGKSMLAHTAYREAEVAINTICGRHDEMRYNAIPAVIYTNPEVSSVGETLETATSKGINAHELVMPMMYSGRYMAENERGDGICKLVFAEKKLIGVHMIGNPSSEIIATAALALTTEISVETFKKTVFPHPSVGEILHEALFHG